MMNSMTAAADRPLTREEQERAELGVLADDIGELLYHEFLRTSFPEDRSDQYPPVIIARLRTKEIALRILRLCKESGLRKFLLKSEVMK